MISKFTTMRNSKRKKNTFDIQAYWDNMPNSVMFVKAMAASGQPIGLETYNKALEEGGDTYFPEEMEYRRKWESVPQEVKGCL